MRINIPIKYIKYVLTNVHTSCLDLSKYLLFLLCWGFFSLSFIAVYVQHLFVDIPQLYVQGGCRSNQRLPFY